MAKGVSRHARAATCGSRASAGPRIRTIRLNLPLACQAAFFLCWRGLDYFKLCIVDFWYAPSLRCGGFAGEILGAPPKEGPGSPNLEAAETGHSRVPAPPHVI